MSSTASSGQAASTGHLFVAFLKAREEEPSLNAIDLCRDCPDRLAPLQQMIDLWDMSSGPDPHGFRQIGGYTLVETLAVGGQGLVFKAKRGSRRPIGLKALFGFEEKAFESHMIARTRVSHASIAPVLDYGVQDSEKGTPCGAPICFIVFPLFPFTSTEFIDRYTPNVPARVYMAAQAATGLQAAHEQLMYHCDLKPQNIVATWRGQPKLIDFEVAEDAFSILRFEVPVRTWPYTPPEVFTRTVRSGVLIDVYGLGAVLYEWLTGKRPYFQARNVHDLQRMIQRGQLIAPRSINGAISPRCADLVMAAMSTDPSQRPSSAKEFAEEAFGALSIFRRRTVYKVMTTRCVSAKAIGRTIAFARWLNPVGRMRRLVLGPVHWCTSPIMSMVRRVRRRPALWTLLFSLASFLLGVVVGICCSTFEVRLYVGN